MIDTCLKELEELYDEMVCWRRYLHEYPELSMKEIKTATFIADKLEEFGLEVRRNVGGIGVIGIIRGERKGKTVALRADFDGLPIEDEKEVSYKSKNKGVMHACGHDAHTSALLGIAKIMNNKKQNLSGNLVLIFQFGEEAVPGGAREMIKDGCLETVDAIFGIHVWSQIPIGRIGYREGYIMATADRFEIEIIGKGGHGSCPHETIDAIVLGSSFILKLQQIISRKIDPLKSAVISVGSFNGGNGFNVIAEKVKITGTVRAFQPEIRELIEKEIEYMLKGECLSFGAEYKYVYEKGHPSVYNHPKETTLVVQGLNSHFEKNNIFIMEPIMAGEDFSCYLEKIPGAFFFVGAGTKEKNFPHHHPKFDIEEKAILNASKTLLIAGLTYLESDIK